MKKIFSILCLLVFVMFSAFAGDGQKAEVKYDAAYTPDGGSLTSVNLNHEIQFGYNLDGLKLTAAWSSDWEVTQSALSIGSEINLVEKGKAAFYGKGGLGSTIGTTKTAFVFYGWGVNYNLSDKWAINGNFKFTYYYWNDPISSNSIGLVYKL